METVIWGTKDGEPEYKEQLLYDGGLKLTEKQINLIKESASKDGFGRFRVTTFNGEKPDFTGVVNTKRLS